ncbi:MAG: hypothetical protein F6K39_05330, partial [Okeania sp. SIO3B3]|nr:hypothetical protein [Okeania sp. SIO3B3]
MNNGASWEQDTSMGARYEQGSKIRAWEQDAPTALHFIEQGRWGGG